MEQRNGISATKTAIFCHGSHNSPKDRNVARLGWKNDCVQGEEDKLRARSSLSTIRCGEQHTFKNPTTTEASSSPIGAGFIVYRQHSLVFDRMAFGVKAPRAQCSCRLACSCTCRLTHHQAPFIDMKNMKYQLIIWVKWILLVLLVSKLCARILDGQNFCFLFI